MNKYLVKIADHLDKPGPAATAAHQSIAGILPDIAMGALGGKLGAKFGARGAAVGATTGTILGGLGANYAVLKHQQLKQQKGQ